MLNTIPTPDDHLTAGPHCRVTAAVKGHVCGAGSPPTIGTGIVSSAGIQIRGRDVARATPHDHFAARPYCRVKVSGFGCVRGGGRCPTVRIGTVPSTRV
jgi:hypothetical protein